VEDVSIAFMLALERLSPLERAAFLLHEVFDLDFAEIGRQLERSPAACRKLASRARNRVRTDHARRKVSEEEGERLFRAFSEAVRSLDMDALAELLREDAVMLSDGGGKVRALPRPLQGSASIAKAFIGFARPVSHAWRLEPARINGLPGCLVFEDKTNKLIQAIALAPSPTEPGRVGALYIQRNPDKLRGVLAAWGGSGTVD
jgi:RNA polymerase sigma-70 factor (ECF subfamily)